MSQNALEAVTDANRCKHYNIYPCVPPHMSQLRCYISLEYRVQQPRCYFNPVPLFRALPVVLFHMCKFARPVFLEAKIPREHYLPVSILWCLNSLFRLPSSFLLRLRCIIFSGYIFFVSRFLPCVLTFVVWCYATFLYKFEPVFAITKNRVIQ